jgi:hypothetical protein
LRLAIIATMLKKAEKDNPVAVLCTQIYVYMRKNHNHFSVEWRILKAFNINAAAC